jgi:hypothetical protein
MKSSSQALRNRSPSRSHLGYSDLPICICNITTFVQTAYQYKQNLFTIASTYFGNTEPSKQLPCIGYTILGLSLTSLSVVLRTGCSLINMPTSRYKLIIFSDRSSEMTAL